MKKRESIDIQSLQEELQGLGMPALRERFALHYGYTPQTRKKTSLIKKILWAIQRDAFGDISELAREKAYSIVDDRDVRERFPNISRGDNPHTAHSVTLAYKPEQTLTPGSVLQRHYQGRDIRILVLDNGFEWEGRYFKSLSAVARDVTGTQWNGKLFFGLKKKGAA